MRHKPEALDFFSPEFDPKAFADTLAHGVTVALNQMCRSLDSVMNSLEPSVIHDSFAIDAEYADVTPERLLAPPTDGGQEE